jgi:transposase
MRKKHCVTLPPADRVALEALLARGRAPAREVTHARVLLKADQAPGGPNWADDEIAEALDVSRPTIERIRKRYATEGLEAALYPRRTRVYQRKVDGYQEAHLIALVCGAPPAGQQRWSLRLLADKMVELGYIEEVSHETVRQVLKKTTAAKSARVGH